MELGRNYRTPHFTSLTYLLLSPRPFSHILDDTVGWRCGGATDRRGLAVCVCDFFMFVNALMIQELVVVSGKVIQKEKKNAVLRRLRY